MLRSSSLTIFVDKHPDFKSTNPVCRPLLVGAFYVIVKTSRTSIFSSKADRRQIPDPRPILLVGRFISLGYLSSLFTLFV